MVEGTGWLIEDTDRSHPPHWLRILRWTKSATVVWTDDASVALRFCRREDAENFWFLCPQPGIIPVITEHGWDSATPDLGGEHG